MVDVWTRTDTTPSLFAFAAFYGNGAAGLQSLYPPAVSSLTTDLSKAGVRIGKASSVVVFASLTGHPLAGASVNENGDYFYKQM